MKTPLLQLLQRLLGNQRGEVAYTKFIGLAIAVVLMTALVPTVFEAINGTDTTDWNTLTGGAGAITLFQIILLIFVAAIVIYMVKSAIE